MNLSRLSVLASAVAALMMGASAQAAPLFTIDPNAIPGTAGKTPFQADFISGTTSELLTYQGGGVVTGSGWAQFTSFSNFGNVIFGGDSGLGNSYKLYLTFDLANQLTAGSAFQAGSEYALTQLDFKVWVDPTFNTSFTQANAPLGQGAVVGGTTSDDILLGFGALIGGVADLNAGGGAAINALNSFALCTGPGTAKVGSVTVPAADCTSATGRAYFSQPDPFYQMTFSEFNNTAQGVLRNSVGAPAVGDLLSITNASGGVDFLAVPEPTSLALAGLALVGFGAASLRKRKV